MMVKSWNIKKTVSILNKILWKIMTTNKETD